MSLHLVITPQSPSTYLFPVLILNILIFLDPSYSLFPQARLYSFLMLFFCPDKVDEILFIGRIFFLPAILQEHS